MEEKSQDEEQLRLEKIADQYSEELSKQEKKERKRIFVIGGAVLMLVIFSIFMLDLGKCDHKVTLEKGINFIVLLKNDNIGILNYEHNYENDTEIENMIKAQMITDERQILAKYKLTSPKKICMDQYIKEVQ